MGGYAQRRPQLLSLGMDSRSPQGLHIVARMIGVIQIMTIEEDAPTSVGQAHDGALADLRIIRRPENVTEANLAEVFAVYLQGNALYCFDDKHWYLWNGLRWRKDRQTALF